MAACWLRSRPSGRSNHRPPEDRLWPQLLAARSRNRRSCAALRHSAHHRRRARLGRPQRIALHRQRDVGSGRGGTVCGRLRSRSARRGGRGHAGYGRGLSTRGQEHGAKRKQGRDAPARRQQRAADRNPGPQHHRHFHTAHGDRTSADRRPVPAGDACRSSTLSPGRRDSQPSRAFRRSGVSPAQPHTVDDRRRRNRCSGDRRANPLLYPILGTRRRCRCNGSGCNCRCYRQFGNRIFETWSDAAVQSSRPHRIGHHRNGGPAQQSSGGAVTYGPRGPYRGRCGALHRVACPALRDVAAQDAPFAPAAVRTLNARWRRPDCGPCSDIVAALRTDRWDRVHGRSPFNEFLVVIFDMLKNSIAIVASHCCDHVARFVEERFFGISVPVATATGIAPQPHCHQETDMLDAQTRKPRNLTVDGITINILSLPDAVSSIVSAAQHGDNFSVCTLNLDHVVQLQQRSDFRAAYRRARFVTADGFPIVVLSRLLGTRITRTTGSDLVEPVCQEAQKKGLPIFMLGSNDRTLSITAKRLSQRFRGLEVAGYYAPGANFDPYSSEADFAIDSIRASGAKLCFVALGAPRQELFAARCLDQLNGTGLLCIGAALDFIAGTQTRAPSLTQKVGLEWAGRMLREPRLLAPPPFGCGRGVS